MKTKLSMSAACLLLPLLHADAAGAAPMPRNWPLPPSQLEQMLEHEAFQISKAQSAGAGVTGASKLTLAFADGRSLKVKWKAAPRPSLDGWNNSPRKELATYAVQRWLLDEPDFLVPTVVPRCIELDRYRAVDPKPQTSVPGSSCVLGLLAIWISDVTAPPNIYDAARFAKDPRYAASMADFNLLTYLVDHRDGRRGNFLLSTDPADQRVFAIDNGIAFGPFPWNFFVTNWNQLRVPWLRRESVERLRKVGRAELAQLGVLADLRVDQAGILQMEKSPGANMDASDGVRIAAGHVQFGLTKNEIDELAERIEDLLEDVDKGKIRVQ